MLAPAVVPAPAVPPMIIRPLAIASILIPNVLTRYHRLRPVIPNTAAAFSLNAVRPAQRLRDDVTFDIGEFGVKICRNANHRCLAWRPFEHIARQNRNINGRCAADDRQHGQRGSAIRGDRAAKLSSRKEMRASEAGVSFADPGVAKHRFRSRALERALRVRCDYGHRNVRRERQDGSSQSPRRYRVRARSPCSTAPAKCS